MIALARTAMVAGSMLVFAPSLSRVTAVHAQAPTSWEFDLPGMDRSIQLGDNFYTFANGRAVDAMVIPRQRSFIGPSAALAELSDQRMKGLLETAAASHTRQPAWSAQAGALFASFMDTATLDARGLAPLRSVLDSHAPSGTIRSARALYSQSQWCGAEYGLMV